MSIPRLVYHEDHSGGTPILLAVLFLGGIQLLGIGILGNISAGSMNKPATAPCISSGNPMLNNEELSSHIKNIAFIITAIAIAYFPLWSSMFSRKNDFYTQYFLQRFFIGESI